MSDSTVTVALRALVDELGAILAELELDGRAEFDGRALITVTQAIGTTAEVLGIVSGALATRAESYRARVRALEGRFVNGHRMQVTSAGVVEIPEVARG